MKKLLVILLLFFPVHGASWEDPFENKTDPQSFGENSEFSRQWIKNKIKKTITLKVHNSSAGEILVIKSLMLFRDCNDDSTQITYSRYKEVHPGMQGSVTVNNPVGFEKIECYSLSWTSKNALTEYLRKKREQEEIERERRTPPPEKTWLEKQKEKKQKKANAKDFCARSSAKAKTNKAADRIYNSCMERRGY